MDILMLFNLWQKNIVDCLYYKHHININPYYIYMMETIYIISSLEKSKKNKCKVGKHTEIQKRLSRHQTCPMESIYIISTLKKSKINKYKIGRHTGTQRKLLSRYRTYLIDPIIYYFRPVNNFVWFENKIKSELNEYLIRDEDNIKTEWIILKLSKLINAIDNIIETNDDHNNSDNDDSDNDNDNDNDNNNNDDNIPGKILISAKFKCIRCLYKTDNETHFNDHLNRKIPCNINKPHKLIKEDKTNYCKSCDQYFSRRDSLSRHNKKLHPMIKGNN